MNELTDEEINVVTVEQWADKTYPLAAYRTYARAIIQKDRAKRQADPALLTDEQCAAILASAEGARNAQADAFNQWDRLGCDEKLTLAGSALIAADRAQRQAGPLPDPQTLKQAHEAWRLTLPRQSAMDSESAAFVAGFKAQRQVETYDQTALELSNVMGWLITALHVEHAEGLPQPYRDLANEAETIIAKHEAQRPADPDLTIAYMSGVADGKAQLQVGQEPVAWMTQAGNVVKPLPDDNGAGYGWTPLYTAPQPAQVPEGWIEIRLPQDGQAIEGKSAIDAPVWTEDYDAREPLSNMRFWRPAPD